MKLVNVATLRRLTQFLRIKMSDGYRLFQDVNIIEDMKMKKCLRKRC